VRICYVDEAGDTRDLPVKPPHGGITPVLVVAGLVIDQAQLEHFTRAFIALKARWYPTSYGATRNGSGASCTRSRAPTYGAHCAMVDRATAGGKPSGFSMR
jgi:hypothetical protein